MESVGSQQDMAALKLNAQTKASSVRLTLKTYCSWNFLAMLRPSGVHKFRAAASHVLQLPASPTSYEVGLHQLLMD
jgi:hypothetical protein